MHRPRKRFGQNFLRDRHVLDKIIAAAQLSAGDRVFEIGPGPGALTERLLACDVELLAAEIDRDLAAALQARNAPNLSVICDDVLRLDWADLLSRPPYTLVANLPYNISSQVLFQVLDHRERFRRLVLMFQLEVGDRLLAQPATRDYGILSVLVQTWFRVTRVVRVPPRAFVPPPRVDSVVLLFEPLAVPAVELRDEAVYRDLVRAAFAQRRKTLRNSLLGVGWDAAVVDQILEETGVDPKRRGETLCIAEFGALANRVGLSTGGE